MSFNVSRFLHTVRYLKPRQIGWRLYYLFMRRQVWRQAMAPLAPVQLRPWQSTWSAPAWMAPCLVRENEFFFLGERGKANTAEDWNHTEKSKLWLYNLHYFDDLNATEAFSRFPQHCRLFERWISENPPLIGNGWEPYPLSLRLVNLVKWLAGPSWKNGGEPIPSAWLKSLARQAQALSAQCEHHILGNHLFANGKALVFAGAFLERKENRWLEKGLAILDYEIPEQFLSDGGHFERSPMYHAILLWDLCDLIHLSNCSRLPVLREREAAWRERLAKGLDWLAMMVHPDGHIAFFNDAALGIAPTLDDLRRYAETLDVVSPAYKASSLVVTELNAPFAATHAEPSGYVMVDYVTGCRALLDIAPVGPDYQPGHAHADTLSFELSLFSQRVLVNSGTSQYGVNNERQRQRSTAAHNTVEIDGQDSSEVWAGFRVARRARASKVLFTAKSGQLEVYGSHDGYRRLPGKVKHQRGWIFTEGALIVHDMLEGYFNHAEARFHCHPAVHVELHDSQLGILTLPDGKIIKFATEGGLAKVEATTWHPRFGESLPNQCLIISFNQPRCTTTFSWA